MYSMALSRLNRCPIPGKNDWVVKKNHTCDRAAKSRATVAAIINLPSPAHSPSTSPNVAEYPPFFFSPVPP